MPVEDRSRLTSPFGKRSLDYLASKEHWGQDFGGPTAGQSVKAFAACDATVEFTHGTVKYRTGPVLKLRTPDGGAICYGHVRNVRVKAGQKVKRGDWIAETWHTGIPLEWGIHLHFERWADTNNHASVVDPLPFLEQYGWAVKWDAQSKVNRVHDEWEGRATKTPPKTNAAPVTVKPAATKTPAPAKTMEDTLAKLDRDDLENIRKIIREEAPKAVWSHTLNLPRGGGETTTGAIHASDYMNNKESYAVVKALAKRTGLSAEEIESIIRDSIREGLASGVELEATLNVKEAN